MRSFKHSSSKRRWRQAPALLEAASLESEAQRIIELRGKLAIGLSDAEVRTIVRTLGRAPFHRQLLERATVIHPPESVGG